MRGMQTARKAGGDTGRDGCGSAHDWAPRTWRTMIVPNRGTAVPRLGATLLYERKRKSPETSELVSGLFRLCSCTIMRATRFELATFWSVARRSIQLSYARIALFSNASVILQKRRANVKHQFEKFFTSCRSCCLQRSTGRRGPSGCSGSRLRRWRCRFPYKGGRSGSWRILRRCWCR